MIGRIGAFMLCGALLLSHSARASEEPGVEAKEAPPPRPPAENLVTAALDRATTKALGEDIFGETLSLSTGAIGFQITDIDLPGNGPPVQLVRSHELRDSGRYLNRMAEWDLQIPRITSTGAKVATRWNSNELASLWSVAGASPFNRCSQFGEPVEFDVPGSAYPSKAESWWTGVEIRVPGRAAQTVLKRGPASPLSPNWNNAAHPLVTKDGWALSCLPATNNGVPGEAFLARAPDGTTYRFDWMVATPIPVARVPASGYINPDTPELWIPVYVFEVSLYATQVTDRFGNSVTYSYAGDKLVKIAASDGRALDLQYIHDAYGYPKLASATVQGVPSRTWTYQYDTKGTHLHSVVLPDSSAWKYTPTPRGFNGYVGHRYSIKMRSPSGVDAEFKILQRGKSRRYAACLGAEPDGPYRVLDPCWVLADSLEEKTYTGPGVNLSWRYHYSDWPDDTASTVVVAPDGSRTRFVVGNSSLSALDGLLLRKDEGARILPEKADWTLTGAARSTTFEYQSFAARVGTAPQGVANRGQVEHRTVEKRRVIVQDGVDFTRRVDTFDSLARPTRTATFADGPVRTTSLAYHDDIEAYVLGQVASTTNVETGLVESRTEYDATTALPLRTYAFEKLQQRLTWYGNGNLASSSDGRDGGTVNTSIGYSSYKRGIPQLISNPDGTTRKLVVDDFGQILSVTDETGAKTCHAYDAMGRLAKTTFPSETQQGVCDTSAWNAVDRAFVPIDSLEYGLGAGHWREHVAHGNANTLSYYDGLWRPVLTRTYDATDISNTLSQVVTRYDAAGRPVYQSYPTRAIITHFEQSLPGTRTTYDAIGRATRVEQDAEAPWGKLATTLQYEQDFITRVTNPRGKQTTFAYQAFDEPATDRPIAIAQLGGAFTGITRDVFGKPTKLTRRNADSSISVSRNYAYNDAQELCRIVEPESAATLFGYDAAGNLKWSAAGLPSASACDAEGDTASILARKVTRHYDARNRVTHLLHPDGRGDTTYAYTPDGLPATLIADNGDGNLIETTYAYNARRLPTLDTMTWDAASVQWSVANSYSRNGHLSHREYPRSLGIYYAPNALGQPTKAGDFATGVTWHANGAIEGFTYGNGIAHTSTQNARQLPLRTRDAHGTTAVFDDSYDYDPNANLAAISDGLPGQRGDRTMTYDTLDRLASATSPMFGGQIDYAYDVLDNITSLIAPNRNLRYCYDDGTNRLTFVRSGASSCSTGAATTSFTYDAQGNVTGKNNVAYQFDFGNRLRSTSGGVASSYVYDATGRRVRDTTTGTRFSFYTQEGQLAFTSNNRAKESSNYIYLGDRLIATRTWPNGVANPEFTTKYHHTDALGSPVAVTDASRAVVERSEYEPYGKLVNRPLKDGVGYTGHVEDAATNQTYMQQRYFDKDVPRGSSVDPVRPSLLDGSNFNRYWYANNNPYKFNDPDGRIANFVVKAGIDFGLEVAIQYATTGKVDLASAAIETGKGLLNPLRTVERAKDLGRLSIVAARGPKPNNGVARKHGGDAHEGAIRERVSELRGDNAASNIRVNQQQVDADGNKVGTNRPDIQYDKGGCHYCVEFDTVPSNSQRHAEVISKNDPKVKIELNILHD